VSRGDPEPDPSLGGDFRGWYELEALATRGRHHAELERSNADLIAVGRVALREPSWPLRASAELDVDSRARYPDSYLRGRWPAVEPVR